jgi:hypothetical protein
LGDRTFLLGQAVRLRRLARDVLDADAERALLALAAEYDERAAAVQDPDPEPVSAGSTPR